ncbi:putative lipoprotein YfhM [bacterium HR15]|nr:putative lipoprotein YfhM [bacterium HR15]
MSRRMGVAIAWIAILLVFQLYGIAELIRNETPRARFLGVAISDKTGQPIPYAHITLIRVEKEEQRDSEGYFYEYYRLDYSGEYEIRADAQGRFSLRGIPAGLYEVRASSRAHHFPPRPPSDEERPFRIELKEGAREELTLRMEPDDPFLDLIHPQPVYHPDEPVKLGIRGFAPADELEIVLYRLDRRLGMLRNPRERGRILPKFVQTLNEIRYGWWRETGQLTDFLKAYAQYLAKQHEQAEPIRGRDPEGVFTQYVLLPDLTQGIYIAIIRAGPVMRPALLIVSHAGLIAKCVGNHLEVWATELKTGQPLPNLPVAAMTLQSGRNGEIGFAEGNTTHDGRWVWTQAPTRDLLIIAYDSKMNAPIVWFPLYRWEEEAGAPLRGAIYTERPLYRPGDTIHFKGVVRQVQSASSSATRHALYQPLPAGTPVEITIYDPQDEPIARQTLRLTDFSSFSGSFETTPESRTGWYRIVAMINGERIEGDAIIATYRKPVYRISLKPSQELYLPDERVEVELKSEYYFGMPVPNTKFYYRIYRSYDYDDWYGIDEEESERFIPRDDEYEEESGDYYGEGVLRGEAQTDEMGRALLRIPVAELLKEPEREPNQWGWYERPTAYRCTLRVEMLTAGAEFAEASTTFSIASTYWRLRMNIDPSFGMPGQPYTVHLQVSDRRSGAPVQTRLRWRVGERLWRAQRYVVDYKFEGEVQTNAQGKAEFAFTPPYSGDWEVRVEGRDEAGYTLVQTDMLWIWDRSYTPRTPPEAQLELRVNKRDLAVGEPLQFAIRASQPNATLWLTLEGDRLYHSQIVPLRNGVATLRLTPPPDAIPNAFVNVCMVQNKRFIERRREVRIGVREQKLHLTLQTDKQRYAPRETVQVQVQVTDAQGRPVQAELSLAVVDESLYALRPDNFRLLRAFYAPRWNRVRTEFSAPWLAWQGDKGAVEVEMRRLFRDTAFWIPTLKTDAQGIARVQFPLPDNLTEWRLSAHAHTLQTLVGYGKITIKCAKDLMVNLRMPTWLVEGDRTRISTVVSNDTQQPREVEVELRTPDGSRKQTVQIGAGKTVSLHWDYTARIPAQGATRLPSSPDRFPQLTFQATARDRTGGLTDAEERKVTLMPFALRQTFGYTTVLNGSRELTLTVQPDAIPDLHRLEVQLTPSVLNRIYGSLPYLLDYPYGCVEQTTSRFLPAVLTLNTFRQMGIKPSAEIQRRIQTITRLSLERLRRFQQENGGWGWWEAEEPDLWITAYVMQALHQAKEAGVPVPEKMYSRGHHALITLVEKGLAEWEKTRSETIVLHARGDTMSLLSAIGALSEISTSPPVDRAALGRYLQFMLDEAHKVRPHRVHPRPPHWSAELLRIYLRWRRYLLDADVHIARLWSLLQQTSYEETNLILWFHSPQEDDRWYWLPSEPQAEILLALLESGGDAERLFGTHRRYEELVRKTVMGLLSLSQGDHWYSSRDTARALDALLAYSRRYERALTQEQSVQLQVWINGVLAGETRIRLEDPWKAVGRLSLNPRLLHPGENRLELRPVSGAPLVSVRFDQWIRLRPDYRPSVPDAFKITISRVEHLRDDYEYEESVEPGNNPFESRELSSGDTVPQGSLIRVEVEAKVPSRSVEASYLVLETPFFAGCAPTERVYDAYYYWDAWVYQYSELRDDRALAYRTRLSARETMRYSLILRAEVPGEYHLLPPRLWAMYAPFEAHGTPFVLKVR